MRPKNFTFRGLPLRYLQHKYNHATYNMRSVEVPIIARYLRGRAPSRILEVGNVLSHYLSKASWPVIDLRDGAIMADVMLWRPKKSFSLICSISTLEHIGYRRAEHSNLYTPTEITDRLRNWLQPGGILVATVPLAYNPAWDEVLRSGDLDARVFFMRRISDDNAWEECDTEAAFAADQTRWRWGAAVAILEWGNPQWGNT